MRTNVDELTHTPTIAKFNDARDFRKQRVVLAQADIHTGLDLGAALANNNRSAGNQLASESLNAQPLRI